MITTIEHGLREAGGHKIGMPSRTENPLPVVYGGGLKRENAAEIGRIGSIDGGLVTLTKFTDPIGFDVGELVRNYTKGTVEAL